MREIVNTSLRIILFSLIIVIMLAHVSMAVEPLRVYGVKIHLINKEVLDGYILTDWDIDPCNKNKGSDKLTSYLARQRHLDANPIRAKRIDKEPQSGEQIENIPDKSQPRIKGNRTIEFIGKLVKIDSNKSPNFFSAKSSVKKIKISDINRIEGVCRKWSGTDVTSFHGFHSITDYMAEYASKHKIIATYTFSHNSDGTCITYFSYNPEYPLERLRKQRELIDKMSEDTLDRNKVIRVWWMPD